MTLFDRIGGADTVREMVDSFYSRVLADSSLRPFFENASIDQLKTMQSEFFAMALDGPSRTSDFDLAKIHQGKGIRREHVTRFADHLIAVLDDRNSIDRRDAMDIVFRIATYTDQVIGDSGGADG